MRSGRRRAWKVPYTKAREPRECADHETRDDDREDEEHRLDPVQELALLRLEFIVGERAIVV